MAVAACGSSGGDPLSGRSASQVGKEAVTNLRSATSFTMTGTMSQPGTSLGVHLGYQAGKGCEGTVTEPGKGSLDLVVIGSAVWVKPNDAFWQSYAGSNASQEKTLAGGKYLKGTAGNANTAALAKLCDAKSLTASITLPENVSKGKITSVNGRQVLPLTNTENGGTVYVTDTSTPEFVEITGSYPADTGKMSFAVGVPVKLAAPPPSQTVDGAAFGF